MEPRDATAQNIRANCGKSIALCGLIESDDNSPLFSDEEILTAPVCKGDFPVAASELPKGYFILPAPDPDKIKTEADKVKNAHISNIVDRGG